MSDADGGTLARKLLIFWQREELLLQQKLRERGRKLPSPYLHMTNLLYSNLNLVNPIKSILSPSANGVHYILPGVPTHSYPGMLKSFRFNLAI